MNHPPTQPIHISINQSICPPHQSTNPFHPPPPLHRPPRRDGRPRLPAPWHSAQGAVGRHRGVLVTVRRSGHADRARHLPNHPDDPAARPALHGHLHRRPRDEGARLRLLPARQLLPEPPALRQVALRRPAHGGGAARVGPGGLRPAQDHHGRRGDQGAEPLRPHRQQVSRSLRWVGGQRRLGWCVS